MPVKLLWVVHVHELHSCLAWYEGRLYSYHVEKWRKLAVFMLADNDIIFFASWWCLLSKLFIQIDVPFTRCYKLLRGFQHNQGHVTSFSKMALVWVDLEVYTKCMYNSIMWMTVSFGNVWLAMNHNSNYWFHNFFCCITVLHWMRWILD